jgi:hypothetical protein
MLPALARNARWLLGLRYFACAGPTTFVFVRWCAFAAGISGCGLNWLGFWLLACLDSRAVSADVNRPGF